MSWQAYVDTSLVGTGFVDKAAIFSNQGDSKWASSTGFDVALAEVKTVLDSYSDKKEVKDVQGEGFHIHGTRYVTIKADERSLYGKHLKEGVCCVITKQALIIAHYPETVQPGSAANTVERLGDYLIGLGY